MKYKILCAAVTLALLAGCGTTYQKYALNSVSLARQTSAITSEYRQVEAALRQIQKTKHIFSDDEWRELLNVDAIMDMFISKLGFVRNSSGASLSDVRYMYGMVVDGYSRARQVVANHWDEFTPSTQVLLGLFDGRVHDANEEINNLLANPTNENVEQAVTLMSGIVGDILKTLAISLL